MSLCGLTNVSVKPGHSRSGPRTRALSPWKHLLGLGRDLSVDAHPVLALALGGVHGDVGAAKQLVARVVCALCDRHADRAADRDDRAIDPRRLAQSVEDSPRNGVEF